MTESVVTESVATVSVVTVSLVINIYFYLQIFFIIFDKVMKYLKRAFGACPGVKRSIIFVTIYAADRSARLHWSAAPSELFAPLFILFQ